MISIQLTVIHLSGLKQGERETFTALPLSIGRAPASQLRLAANDTRASTKHAEIVLEGKTLVLKDLQSTNGTYIDGKRVELVKLVNGDVIEFGVGGPKLRFEFVVEDIPETIKDNPAKAFTPPPKVPAVAVKPVASNPQISPLAVSPIAGNLAIASAEKATPSSSSGSVSGMLIEEREFPFRNRFKYVLFSLGLGLILTAILLLVKQILIWMIPAALIGLFLLMMGWSCSRINITANNQGIHYQGILRSTIIRWDEITELKAFRSRTRLLTDLVYIVRSRNNNIVFSIEDYQDGLELANLIARRSRLAW